jgi:glutathione-regulated potassium-efflux system ancillary protein KefC
MAEVIRRHFPNVIVAARAVDRSHAHELMALGVQVFERETFRAAIRLGERALVALGHSEDEASHIATAFEKHDVRMLLDSFEVRHDQAAYVGFVRRSTEMLEQVMRADVQNAEENRRRVAEAVKTETPDAPSEATAEPPVVEDPDLDKEASAESDRR